MLEVPVIAVPQQLFSLVLGGQRSDVTIKYNSRAGIWTADVSNGGQVLFRGLALVSGVELLERTALTESKMYVVNLNNSSADPDFDGFGTSSKVLLLTEEEVENVTPV